MTVMGNWSFKYSLYSMFHIKLKKINFKISIENIVFIISLCVIDFSVYGNVSIKSVIFYKHIKSRNILLNWHF